MEQFFSLAVVAPPHFWVLQSLDLCHLNKKKKKKQFVVVPLVVMHGVVVVLIVLAECYACLVQFYQLINYVKVCSFSLRTPVSSTLSNLCITIISMRVCLSVGNVQRKVVHTPLTFEKTLFHTVVKAVKDSSNYTPTTKSFIAVIARIPP